MPAHRLGPSKYPPEKNASTVGPPSTGPVRLAADRGLLGDRFLVLNGDMLTDFDLAAEIQQHERTGAVATLALAAVDDTASYGVVPTRPDGRVDAFLEKSEGPAPTNRI